MKYSLVLAAVLFMPMPVRALAECSPAKLMKIVTEDRSPAIPSGNFASLPKTLYRLGSTYARIEEQRDVANNTHGLIVVNGRDSWIANLATGKGKHAVDPDETPAVRVPLFAAFASTPGFPRDLLDLEFGCETAFFQSRKSPELPLVGGSERRVKQAFGVGEWVAVLVRAERSTIPDTVFLFKGDHIVSAFKYTEYEEGPPNLQLFTKPEGVAFEEMRPSK